ncbi:hypothetical protein GCM10028805_06280 [Spirosoma harenae]
MASKTLVIIAGDGSVSPKPWKKAYFNMSVEEAKQRFMQTYPQSRDVTIASVVFKDEFTIGPHGEISSSYY